MTTATPTRPHRARRPAGPGPEELARHSAAVAEQAAQLRAEAARVRQEFPPVDLPADHLRVYTESKWP